MSVFLSELLPCLPWFFVLCVFLASLGAWVSENEEWEFFIEGIEKRNAERLALWRSGKL